MSYSSSFCKMEIVGPTILVINFLIKKKKRFSKRWARWPVVKNELLELISLLLTKKKFNIFVRSHTAIYIFSSPEHKLDRHPVFRSFFSFCFASCVQKERVQWTRVSIFILYFHGCKVFQRQSMEHQNTNVPQTSTLKLIASHGGWA